MSVCCSLGAFLAPPPLLPLLHPLRFGFAVPSSSPSAGKTAAADPLAVCKYSEARLSPPRKFCCPCHCEDAGAAFQPLLEAAASRLARGVGTRHAALLRGVSQPRRGAPTARRIAADHEPPRTGGDRQEHPGEPATEGGLSEASQAGAERQAAAGRGRGHALRDAGPRAGAEQAGPVPEPHQLGGCSAAPGAAETADDRRVQAAQVSRQGRGAWRAAGAAQVDQLSLPGEAAPEPSGVAERRCPPAGAAAASHGGPDVPGSPPQRRARLQLLRPIVQKLAGARRLLQGDARRGGQVWAQRAGAGRALHAACPGFRALLRRLRSGDA
eukprot:scaffold596_cov236-Pinguiococcus_pyrenoidosus.AAC.20